MEPPDVRGVDSVLEGECYPELVLFFGPPLSVATSKKTAKYFIIIIIVQEMPS